ncbi:hypothetical protein ACFP1Z_21715 [Streptomyces gamaensis]|uniref:Membrane transport protein MMPL domain-containing protein n=1 Tax=Streptomyces gamaensis TaxID=1763542 RepID=A0ABW0Z8Q9_9ACTN
MSRPTPAQIAYGSATVVLSTLAMLLLSQTRSGPGVALIACVALALGLLVAVTVPMPRVFARRVTGRLPQRPAAPAEARMSQHSLR